MQNYVFQLANTNRPPSFHEKNSLVDFITDQEIEIARIEGQIEDAEINLNQLRAQLEQRIRRVYKLKGFLSPLRRLPVELLTEIFRYCHTSTPEYDAHHSQVYSYNMDVLRQSPLLMCQVCSTWRNVAISVPELWDTVFLSFYKARAHHLRRVSVESVYAGAATHLSRAVGSGQVKLFIGPEPPSTSEESEVLQVRPFSHIITSMVGNEVSFRYVNKIMLHTPTSMPRLQTLGIHSIAGEESDLRIMRNMPWSNLVALCITSKLPLMPTSEVLSMCTNLVKCTLTIAADDIDPSATIPSNVPAQTLAHLSNLVIAFEEGYTFARFCSHFFDALTLPALKHFTIDFMSTESGFDERFIRFKERSSLNLKSFRLECGIVSAEEIVEFLDRMPDLNSIYLESDTVVTTLNNPHFTDALKLGHPNRIDTLAPHLITLGLRESGLDTYDETVFERVVSMVESWSASRHEGIIGIGTKVNLSSGKLTEPSTIWPAGRDFRARLDACREAGMDLTFNGPP